MSVHYIPLANIIIGKVTHSQYNVMYLDFVMTGFELTQFRLHSVWLISCEILPKENI